MKLDALIEGLATRHAGPEVEVADLTSDSREIQPGWAFLALRGGTVDGAAFVPQALARGAVAVISEAAVPLPEGVAGCAFQGEPRLRMADLARRLHREPEKVAEADGVARHGQDQPDAAAPCFVGCLA